MTWVAGVDGCPRGWFAVLRHVGSKRSSFQGPLSDFSEVLALPENPAIIAVDIPVGLLNEAKHGGRECDRLARALLGRRGCCVFSPPVRAALTHCDNYEAAKEANRHSSDARIGLSRQAFAICKKIREVDGLMNDRLQDVVKEVHPELCFFEINQQHPMPHGKKSKDGLRGRLHLLIKEGFGSVIETATNETLRRDVGQDDILDACAACWTAERIFNRQAQPVEKEPHFDGKHLRMEMWR
jgi:predicted RNase H-like nuclease